MNEIDQLLTYDGKPIPPKRRNSKRRRLYIQQTKIEWNADEAKKIKQLASIISTHSEMAAALGVSFKVWKDFRRAHPEVEDLISDSEEKSKTVLRRLAWQHALDGDFRYFQLIAKRHLGWTSGQESRNINIVQNLPAEEIPETIPTDPNEAAKLYQKLMG